MSLYDACQCQKYTVSVTFGGYEEEGRMGALRGVRALRTHIMTLKISILRKIFALVGHLFGD